MPDFSRRSTRVEMMDDLNYSGPVMNQTLRELDVINRWLGGNAVTMDGLKTLLKKHKGSSPISIADLGCGRGGMLKIISKWSRKNTVAMDLVGIDANPYIVALAQDSLPADQHHIRFQDINIFSAAFQSQRFDIVIGTLFYHHFTEEQLVSLFVQLKNQASIGFIINDIHRHPLAFHSIRLLTLLFSRSPMVKYDAPLSVLRAFKRAELESILRQAGIVNFIIKWKWAFRWQVIVFGRQAS